MRSIEETDKNLRKNSHTVQFHFSNIVILTKLKSRIGAFFRKIIFVTFWEEQQGGKLFLLRKNKKDSSNIFLTECQKQFKARPYDRF